MFKVAWADIFPEYTILRKQFIKRLNKVDIYDENNTVELKTK
jgi:hypothetical protein